MTKFNKNVFIKWTSTDEDGKFSYVGQVISHVDGMIVFHNSTGTMGVPEDEGTFAATRKPKKWNTKAPVAVKSVKPVKKKAHRSTKSDGSFTKYHQVVAQMNENRPASRKDAIALVVREVGMTPAGASTYVAKANKELKLW